MRNPPARARLRVLRLAGVGGFLFGLWSDPCPVGASNYSIHSWEKEDGLPHNSVTAIVQSRDGYLWLGTYAGLVRFDGVRFTIFDSDNAPALMNGRITSAFEDRSGALWIGHETGDLTRMQSGKFEPVEIPGGWSGGKILRIGTDADENVWIMNKEGLLARVRDGRLLSPDEGVRAPLGLVRMAKDRSGRLWVVRGGELAFVEHGQFTRVVTDKSREAVRVDAICAAHDGGIWIVCGGRLRQWKDGAWAGELRAEPNVFDAVTTLQETQPGVVAVGTPDQGLYLLSEEGPTRHFSQENGLAQNWVACSGVDREGDIWVGTGNGGLSVLRPVNFEQINSPDKWNGMAVLSITTAKAGGLWIGTEGAGLYRFRNGEWRQFGAEAGITSKFIWSVLEDADGRLWVGTWGGGLFVQNGDRFESAAGLEKFRNPVTALLHGRHGELWAGTGSGLLRYEDGKSACFGARQGIKVPDVRAVYEDADGTIWFGMQGGGLGSLKDGNIRQYRKEDGLASDFVLCFRADGDEGLWIGTGGGGLNRLRRGSFARVGPQEGLPKKVISHIEDDGSGDFWMSTEAGIIRVSKRELNACADGQAGSIRCLTYGLGDGLETIDCPNGFQPAGCKTPDGRLWFPTRKGLAVVDPSNLKVNPLPPPVVIEDVLVDEVAQSLDSKTQDRGAASDSIIPLQVPAGRHRFEFRYTALSFAAPEKVHFKYWLEGWEPDWVDGQTRRSVPYNYLPPGDFCFHVMACNNDGYWNEQGASVSLKVLPFFWQTWWFGTLAYVAGAGLVGGLVFLGARRRHRRKLEVIHRQRALERERARIAKDIHDDLGASLTRIAMLTQSAQKDLQHPQQAANHLESIYTTARELTRAMDEIVWAVNPKHDTLDSVATYLVRFAQDFLAPAGIRCRLDLPVTLPAWSLSAEVRHNLFLAFKEALHNVVRHAAASEVRICLEPQPDDLAFALSIEDNGKGFTESDAMQQPGENSDRLAGGNGLDNMRRRMEEVAGSCTVQSTLGKGTKVKFIVSVSVHAAA